MSHVYKMLGIIALYALMHGHASADEQNLWQFPCDVYMSPACMRLPGGMSVSYEVPADFGMYTVTSSGEGLVKVYVGFAPQLPSGIPSLKLDSTNASMRGFLEKRDGINKLDVVITPKDKHLYTVHLFAQFPDERRSSVAAVLSGMRACRLRGREELRCPAEAQWGRAMEDWINSKSP
jgi:hypothetical protein